MAVQRKYASDVELILSHMYDNGADLWTTPDKSLIKGAPFSILESVIYLLELGMEPTEPILKETAELIFSTWQKDGRLKFYPQGSVHPYLFFYFHFYLSPHATQRKATLAAGKPRAGQTSQKD